MPRLPFIETLESRDGSLSQDELLVNCFVDPESTRKYVSKRFGTSVIASLGASLGQGMFRLEADNYAIQNDVLFRISDSTQFTYTPPNPTLQAYQSLNTPDNTRTIMKTIGAGYIFDRTVVTRLPPSGGVSSITMTNAGGLGTIGTHALTFTNAPGDLGVGASGTFTVAGGPAGNTLIFTAETLPGGVANWTAVAFSPTLGTGQGRYCAVGTNVCATSDNGGQTWTARTIPAYAWQAIAWNGTVFCAVPNGSNQAATSSDGITWTQRTLPSSAYRWSSIAWNGAVF